MSLSISWTQIALATDYSSCYSFILDPPKKVWKTLHLTVHVVIPRIYCAIRNLLETTRERLFKRGCSVHCSHAGKGRIRPLWITLYVTTSPQINTSFLTFWRAPCPSWLARRSHVRTVASDEHSRVAEGRTSTDLFFSKPAEEVESKRKKGLVDDRLYQTLWVMHTAAWMSCQSAGYHVVVRGLHGLRGLLQKPSFCNKEEIQAYTRSLDSFS